MIFNKKTDILFRYLKIYGTLTLTWPQSGSKRQKIVYESLWWLTFINVIHLFIVLIMGVFHFRENIDISTQAIAELTALMEPFFDMIICKVQSKRLQVIIV